MGMVRRYLRAFLTLITPVPVVPQALHLAHLHLVPPPVVVRRLMRPKSGKIYLVIKGKLTSKKD